MILKYTHSFLLELQALDRGEQKKVLKALEKLARAEEHNHLPLRGALHAYYKLRVGDYRAVYTIAEGELVFCTVQHRSVVYDWTPDE